MQYCQICQISLLDSFKNSTHKILILVELKNGLSCAFLSDVAGFLKSHFKGPKYFKKVVLTPRKSRMWWYRKGNSVGSWPPAFPRSTDPIMSAS